ncbi:DNA repair and recombination protein RadB [Candidatus Woesearchaeota archaeon]|nr:DNA repair and recombination protein RadB [Candidatus Woesearchaeota archaeon]
MKIETGSSLLDDLLDGGYEKDIVSTIYGPAGSGKTLLCLLALLKIAGEGKKIIYIDTEGGFSVERLKQLNNDYKKILDNVLFLRPTTFKEQKESFERLKEVINEKIGLIIIDTVSMLYRLELGKNEDVYGVNKELGQQLGYLNEIVRKKNIPVLITNQVYADFAKKNGVKIVGGDLLKYGSKCMIELQNGHQGVRKAILRKHRSIAEEKEVMFRIVEKGIEKV